MITRFMEVTEKDLKSILGLPQPMISVLLHFLRKQQIAQKTRFRKPRFGTGRPATLWRLPSRFTLDLDNIRK